MVLAVFIVLVVLFVVLPLIGVALWFLISTAVVGLIVGALGRLIVPGSQPIGILATIVCGLVGSLVGGGIGHAAGLHHFTTILVEIGVAAAGVLFWSGRQRALRSGTGRASIAGPRRRMGR